MRTSDEGSRPLGVSCSCFSMNKATRRLPSGRKGYRAVPPFYLTNMKHLYLKCLLLGILSFTGFKSYAYDCEVDGIFYNLNVTAKTASVTFQKSKIDYPSIIYISVYTGAITIPASFTFNDIIFNVTSIGDHAFYGCSGLTSIEIPNSVSIIGSDAFNGCRGLTSLTIGNNVTTIEGTAFSDCSSLTSIKIPNSVSVIGGYAFSNCSGLTSLTIGNNVTTIESGAFIGCSGLTSIEIPNSVSIIGSSAFSGCSGLTSIEISNSVSSIGSSAFANCSSLKSITFEDGTENISFERGNNSNCLIFDQCPIETVYLGRNMYYYSPYSPFLNKTTLTSLTIGNSVTNIENSAFSGCSGLTSVEIPNMVTSIGQYAFSGSSLTSIIVEDGIETLSFEIPNNIYNTYKSYHFSENQIETLYLGRNISYRGSYSPFSENTTLTSVIIGNNVTNIEAYAFQGSNLTSLIIGNNVVNIGNYAFQGCSGLTSLTIPDRVSTIGNYAFQGCSKITTIDIPDRVNSIGQNAFAGCSGLTTLSLPNSMTSIGDYAFYGCTNLESVCSEITDVFSIDAFGNGSENATLYVPYGKKLTYIQTPGWNVFNDIIEMDPAIMNTSLLLSCNSKGSITINGTTVFTNKIGSVDILEDAENTIVFTPKANCKLEQVCFNGFDVTTSVENNTLKAVIPAKSQMVVTFAKESGDMNNDGIINISDVVVLVNMILGQ